MAIAAVSARRSGQRSSTTGFGTPCNAKATAHGPLSRKRTRTPIATSHTRVTHNLLSSSSDRAVFCCGIRQVDLITKHAVNHIVAVAPLAERGAAQYAFPGEPSLLQGPLLSHIGDLRGGLYAVDRRMGEQVANQQLLRRRTVAATPELRCQPDTDRPIADRTPSMNLVPVDHADAIGAVQHDQYPTVVAEQPRLSPGLPHPFRIAPPMPLIRAYGGRVIHQAREPGQIVFHHRPEGHLAIHESQPTADRSRVTSLIVPDPARRLFHSAAGTLARARPRMAGTMNAARAAAIDSPAATTNAREYPASRAAATDVAPWPAASAACARSVAIVASTARPREPPICREVLRTPEASPASVKATPAVAAAASGVNSRPRASAIRQPGPNTCAQYELSGVIADSQAKPPAATTVPVSSSGRTPVRGMIRELAWAPMMIVTPMGRNARPVFSAL